MPSHTAASALLKLYVQDDKGIPWCWEPWKKRTNVQHGLFPEEDSLLPSPWTRQDARYVEEYFHQYSQLPDKGTKIKYSRNSPHPGRRLWADFVSKNWGKWGVHQEIVDCLQEANIHPVQLIVGGEDSALAAFNDVSGKVTKAVAVKVIKAVHRWKTIAEVYGTEENVSKAGVMLDELHRLLEKVGAKKSKQKQVSKSEFATEEDLQQLLHVYTLYFDHADDDNHLPLEELEEQLTLKDVDTGDLGMEMEFNLPPETLAHNLGFIKNRLPHQFNPRRHLSSLNPWESVHEFSDSGSKQLVPNSLHWHQLAGVHSIGRRMFDTYPDTEACTGFLVCDEVGLGKMAQTISLITFLNQVAVMQENGEELPPLLASKPYLKGKDHAPSLPHVIVCPGTLRAQWIQEIKMLFISKSVDILIYDCPRSGNPDFWGPDGELVRCKHSSRNIIIITTHSSLQNEFSFVFKNKTSRSASPWQLPDRKRKTEGTIFHQKFLSVSVDEMHLMRNVGIRHWSVLALLEQTTVKIGLTATPLLTSPKDILSLGRLLGIPYFVSQQSVEDAKDDAALLRQAKKKDDDGHEIRCVQIESVQNLQTHFSSHILRRTIDSRNWRGKSLLDLPPHKEIITVVDLTDRERCILDKQAEIVKETIVSGNETAKYLTKVSFRMYAQDHDGPIPVFITKEEWKAMKSTKIDIVMLACRWYLWHDEVLDMEFRDGKAQFPNCIPMSDNTKRTRKILIYSEFITVTPLLKNILELYGMKSLSINGTMSFEWRDAVIAQLHVPDTDVIIFLDQPWSAQDERQIRGRAHRQPQRKEVKVIHVLANNSSDILIETLMTTLPDMHDLLSGRVIQTELKDEDEDDEDDNKGDAHVEVNRRASPIGPYPGSPDWETEKSPAIVSGLFSILRCEALILKAVLVEALFTPVKPQSYRRLESPLPRSALQISGGIKKPVQYTERPGEKHSNRKTQLKSASQSESLVNKAPSKVAKVNPFARKTDCKQCITAGPSCSGSAQGEATSRQKVGSKSDATEDITMRRSGDLTSFF
ncbi:hypothetical protein K435DRAFT_864524 [Dendrothele bispora CBS 962.96]|uniref:Helicase ATP-binding domain-containing protein n=1 Tax=Dendrothele bispora (strain CBS 962.96) TaxID=1314807 RepID=A0A4S8LLU1_DENBC|nr:hypothetical protein K435DRAFT_864524 [Dendrothele bispora CBS 962.96]